MEVPALLMARDLTDAEQRMSEIDHLIMLTHIFYNKFQGILIGTPVT